MSHTYIHTYNELKTKHTYTHTMSEWNVSHYQHVNQRVEQLQRGLLYSRENNIRWLLRTIQIFLINGIFYLSVEVVAGVVRTCEKYQKNIVRKGRKLLKIGSQEDVDSFSGFVLAHEEKDKRTRRYKYKIQLNVNRSFSAIYVLYVCMYVQHICIYMCVGINL